MKENQNHKQYFLKEKSGSFMCYFKENTKLFLKAMANKNLFYRGFQGTDTKRYLLNIKWQDII